MKRILLLLVLTSMLGCIDEEDAEKSGFWDLDLPSTKTLNADEKTEALDRLSQVTTLLYPTGNAQEEEPETENSVLDATSAAQEIEDTCIIEGTSSQNPNTGRVNSRIWTSDYDVNHCALAFFKEDVVHPIATKKGLLQQAGTKITAEVETDSALDGLTDLISVNLQGRGQTLISSSGENIRKLKENSRFRGVTVTKSQGSVNIFSVYRVNVTQDRSRIDVDGFIYTTGKAIQVHGAQLSFGWAIYYVESDYNGFGPPTTTIKLNGEVLNGASSNSLGLLSNFKNY